jgi:AcrR family transcriptional regulator
MAARTPRLPPEVRRRELLDAALDVIYEQGFPAVTVEAVVRRAGVTRPVLYDLFGDLDGLLLALIDREEQAALAPLLAIMDAAPLAGGDPEDVLVEGIDAFLTAVRSEPRTWRLVLMPPHGGSPELRARITASRRLVADRLTELLDWGVAERGGPEGLDHALAARLIVAAGEDAARLTLLHPRRYPPERIAGLARDGVALLPPGTRPAGLVTPGALPPLAAAEPAPAPVRLSRADRREQLLDVALDLLAEQGFDVLNMEAIARRAGVNRAVVYRSFANLQLLLLALLRREDARTRKTIDALVPAEPGDRTTAELLAQSLTTFLGAVLRHPQTYRVILLRPESAPLFLQKLVNRRRSQIANRLRPLVEHGLPAIAAPTSNLDVDLVARLVLSAGEELARLALDDPDFTPDRLLASACDLLDRIPVRPG